MPLELHVFQHQWWPVHGELLFTLVFVQETSGFVTCDSLLEKVVCSLQLIPDSHAVDTLFLHTCLTLTCDVSGYLLYGLSSNSS